jgi:hypothetical protein
MADVGVIVKRDIFGHELNSMSKVCILPVIEGAQIKYFSSEDEILSTATLMPDPVIDLLDLLLYPQFRLPGLLLHCRFPIFGLLLYLPLALLSLLFELIVVVIFAPSAGPSLVSLVVRCIPVRATHTRSNRVRFALRFAFVAFGSFLVRS